MTVFVLEESAAEDAVAEEAGKAGPRFGQQAGPRGSAFKIAVLALSQDPDEAVAKNKLRVAGGCPVSLLGCRKMRPLVMERRAQKRLGCTLGSDSMANGSRAQAEEELEMPVSAELDSE